MPQKTETIWTVLFLVFFLGGGGINQNLDLKLNSKFKYMELAIFIVNLTVQES